MLGIYGYYDTQRQEFAYIGKDSHIDKQIRHKTHLSPTHYNEQPFNKILQNNSQRYIYQPLVTNVECENTLTALEIQYIRQLQPRFNFTEGGDGMNGFKHSKETIQKLSERVKGENNPMYGRNGDKNPFYGKKHNIRTKLRMSKKKNSTKYFRVSKAIRKDCKQGFIWRYRYLEDGKEKAITRTDLSELRQEVLKRDLIWKEL